MQLSPGLCYSLHSSWWASIRWEIVSVWLGAPHSQALWVAEGAGKNTRWLQHQLRCFLIQPLSWMCPGVQTLLEGRQARTSSCSSGSTHCWGWGSWDRGQFSSIWRRSQLPRKTVSPTSWQKGCQGPTAATRPRSRQLLFTHNTLCQNLIIFVEKILRKFLRWQEGHLPDILL